MTSKPKLTTANIENAQAFESHRALVAAVVDAKAAGAIDGYSILATDRGLIAGVRVNGAALFLA